MLSRNSHPKTIRLRQVRVNNLKNLSLDIEHGQWLAICGLSGSGKSSLAFDVLYAEGQRRYLECLAPGTRRFLIKFDKPDAELIDGLPPAIAVRPSRGAFDRRSTVGTACEIIEYLRLLYVKLARIVCPVCQSAVDVSHVDSMSQRLEKLPAGTRYIIAFWPEISHPSELSETLTVARKNGFVRAVYAGKTINLDQPLEIQPTILDHAGARDPVENPTLRYAWKPRIVVDRLVAGSSDSSRVRESLETALQFGAGQCQVLMAAESETNWGLSGAPATVSVPVLEIDDRQYVQINFSIKPVCGTCGRQFPLPEPRLFDFGHPESACAACEGTGYADPNFRLRCSACRGDRLQLDGLAFQIHGHRISDLCLQPIEQFASVIDQFEFPSNERDIAKAVLEPIQARLKFLQTVGLGYLTLDRPLATVSSGEAQRIQMTSCLSSTLVNMLYVLDEPSRGLHSQDLPQLIAAIDQLHRRPNTVVVADHHPLLIQSSPRIIEIGPGAGEEGGEIIFDGTASELIQADTATGQVLAGRRGLTFESRRRELRGNSLQLFGASGNNLKSVDARFPLGCLCVVTGVSGAGKSSLVRETLYPAVLQRLEQSTEFRPLAFDELTGVENIDQVVCVDPSPIGRSGRSNPVTYIKAFDEIRQAFAETSDAKARKAAPGHFSFNVAGGRCDKCEGDGYLQFDMQFLADVFVTCDECQGTRYRESTLQIKYRDRNIAEVLRMTAREAFVFFRGQPKVQAKLKALIDVGLDYLRLGQPANTLSDGESQRLKLALHLNTSKQKRTLFIIEEPTRGLHPADVTRLLDGFDSLIGVGHSFVVIEHQLQLIRNSDWVIDLGPGAAEQGGRIIAAGRPEEIAANPQSVTGRFL